MEGLSYLNSIYELYAPKYQKNTHESYEKVLKPVDSEEKESVVDQSTPDSLLDVVNVTMEAILSRNDQTSKNTIFMSSHALKKYFLSPKTKLGRQNYSLRALEFHNLVNFDVSFFRMNSSLHVTIVLFQDPSRPHLSFLFKKPLSTFSQKEGGIPYLTLWTSSDSTYYDKEINSFIRKLSGLSKKEILSIKTDDVPRYQHSKKECNCNDGKITKWACTCIDCNDLDNLDDLDDATKIGKVDEKSSNPTYASIVINDSSKSKPSPKTVLTHVPVHVSELKQRIGALQPTLSKILVWKIIPSESSSSMSFTDIIEQLTKKGIFFKVVLCNKFKIEKDQPSYFLVLISKQDINVRDKIPKDVQSYIFLLSNTMLLTGNFGETTEQNYQKNMEDLSKKMNNMLKEHPSTLKGYILKDLRKDYFLHFS
jgi:hypothetical protein